MKKNLLLATACVSMAFHLNAQTNTFPATGNVGIGTTSPTANLSIVGTGTVQQQILTDATATSRPVLSFLRGANYWNLGMNINQGNTDNFHFRYGSSYNLTLTPGGNLGIGTLNPTTVLQISKNDASTNQSLSNTASLDIWNTNGASNTGGQINFRSDANTGPAGIGAVIGYLNQNSNSTGSAGTLVFGVKSALTDVSVTPAMAIQMGGNVSIGATSAPAKLYVQGTDVNTPLACFLYLDNLGTSGTRPRLNIWGSPGKINLRTTYGNGAGSNLSLGTYTAPDAIFIQESGNIGIGTTTPQNKLDVNGTIHAKEVKVDLTGWSDFVFAPAYKLKPLTEVEQYIKANNHLPEIPSAKEVAQNGISLGDMQAKLLQKVEELTLYTIEQEKAKTELKAKIEEQGKQLQEQRQLKARVEEQDKRNADLQQQLTAQAKEIEELKQLINQKLK